MWSGIHEIWDLPGSTEGAKAEVYTVVTKLAIVLWLSGMMALLCKLLTCKPANLFVRG
jgi:hypothetical protein